MKMLLIAVGLVCAGPAFAKRPAIEMFDYVIVERDSCEKVARKVYKDKRRYDLIHEYNPQLGARPPHRLVPGETLRLPKRIPPDAWVTNVRQQVEHRQPSNSEWSISIPGTELRLGWRVSTRDDSSAELTFLDSSVLQLREETLVILYGKGASGARRKTTRARLEKGTLRTRLAELAGGKTSSLRITTAAAESEFSSGEAVMSVDPEGRSSVSNHAGGQATVRASGAQVKVRKGMGTFVKKGERPAKPRKLPPPPRWMGEGSIAVTGARAEDALIRLRWLAPKGVERVRLRARLLSGEDAVASVDLPVDAGVVRLRGLPAATYALEVSGRDGDGLESRWSNPVVVEIAGASEAPVPTVVGAALGLPSGATCTVDDTPAPQGVQLEPGTHTVACTAQGAALPPIRYTVSQATAAWSGPGAVKPGIPTPVRITLKGEGLPSVLDLRVGGQSWPLVRTPKGWAAKIVAIAGDARAEVRDPDRPGGPPIATLTVPLQGGAQ